MLLTKTIKTLFLCTLCATAIAADDSTQINDKFTQIKGTIDPELRQNPVNTYLDQISRQVTFDKWFFGSMHLDEEVKKDFFGVFNQLLPVNKKEKPRVF